MGGYAICYYAIDVLAWSRSPVANSTRPAPLKYVLGLPFPAQPDQTPFHPIFTLADKDQANAVYAMGGASANATGGAVSGLAGTPGLGIPGLTGGGIPGLSNVPGLGGLFGGG